MPEPTDPTTGEELAERLETLKLKRRKRKLRCRNRNGRRTSPQKKDRPLILSKADGKCHVCGGRIIGGDWEADHVRAHSGGGRHAVENYLPAHALCNNYRWDYLPEESQWILKMGVWAANQTRRRTEIGKKFAAGFMKKEEQRKRRQHRR